MPERARGARESDFFKMAKTYKNLYPQIYAFDNLYLAHRKARRGGKRKYPQVAEFEHNLGENLLQLQAELQNQTYRPGPYRHFMIIERKVRKISAAPYRDRVVHHALMNIIQPIFETRFIFDSYACRKGKGTHRALDRAQYFARRYPYVLQSDIRQFFPSIDHTILRNLISRSIACRGTMGLIDLILESGAGVLANQYTPVYFPGDDLFAATRARGLPIGNLPSQHWANLYLHALDMFVKHTLNVKGYLRYNDDFLLFGADKRQLQQWKEAIMTFLQSLRLTVNPTRTQIFPVAAGIPFLGWRLFPDWRRLRRENVTYAVNRLKNQQILYARGELTFEKLTGSVQARLAHAAHGNTYRLRQQILRRFIFRRDYAAGC